MKKNLDKQAETNTTEDTVEDKTEVEREVNYLDAARSKKKELFDIDQNGNMTLKQGLSEAQKELASVLEVNDKLTKRSSTQTKDIMLLNKRVKESSKPKEVGFTEEQQEQLEEAKLEGNYDKIAKLVNEFKGTGDKEVELDEADREQINRINKFDELDSYSIGKEFDGGAVNWEDLVPPKIMEEYLQDKIGALEVIKYSKSVVQNLSKGRFKSKTEEPPSNMSLNGVAGTVEPKEKNKERLVQIKPKNYVDDTGKLVNVRRYI